MAKDVINQETKLLLQILQRPPGDYDSQFLIPNHESASTIDHEKFCDLVFRNGLVGLIYLLSQKSTFLPKEIINRLKTRYRQITLNNLGQVGEILQLLKIVEENGIDIVLLKGVVDAEKLFNNLGSYPSNDIDTLVRVDELPALCQILNQYGYYAVADINENDLLRSHYHLIYRKNGACIELHWNLVKRYFDIPAEFWWEGANKMTYRGHLTHVLAAEKYLLYLIYRLFDHQFAPFKFLVHISAFISQSKQLDWRLLIEHSKLLGMQQLVVFTIKLVHDIFELTVPVELSTKRVLGYRFLRKLVLKQNFGDNSNPHLVMLLFSLLLLPPPKSAKCILLRIFPTKSEIRLRYRLNSRSKSVYFYMIINPILMLIRSK